MNGMYYKSVRKLCFKIQDWHLTCDETVIISLKIIPENHRKKIIALSKQLYLITLWSLWWWRRCQIPQWWNKLQIAHWKLLCKCSMPKSIFFEVKGQHDLKIQGFNCCLDAAASHMATKFPTLPAHNGSKFILKVHLFFKPYYYRRYIFSHCALNVL